MLGSFSQLAVHSQGISIKIQLWLDGARTFPKYPYGLPKIQPLWPKIDLSGSNFVQGSG